jgi:hypothetical protein
MKISLRKISSRTVLAVLGMILVAPTVAGADQLGPAAAKPRSVVFYSIVSWHDGKCVDDPGGSQASGAQIQQFTCNGTVAQLWEKQFVDNVHFRLRVAASGQCMAVKDASQDEGAPVVQNPCNSNFNQQWLAEDFPGAPGFSRLVARHSGKVLVMQSAAVSNLIPLVQTASSVSNDGLLATAWQFS